MPLLDHFHAPLYPLRSWESFHSGWATEIAAKLNGSILPERYFAEARMWPMPLALGEPLPTLPLALRGGPIVKLDLESTYSEARLRSRL